MSTICKLCLNANQDDVITLLKERFSSLDYRYLMSETERPLTAIERDSFLINYDDPSILSCSQASNKTTEVHFNSFSKMKEFSSWLSKRMNGFVVVNIYQSTATAGYWSYSLKGELLREIEFGDFEISVDSGVKFDFEGHKIGRNIAESNEEPHYSFDYDDMDLYNEKVGLDVEVHQQLVTEWTNFKFENNQKKPDLSKPMGKKWWKFW